MLKSSGEIPEDHPLLKDGVLSADFVANETIKGINAEKVLILPHKQVEKYIQVRRLIMILGLKQSGN